MKKIFLYIFLAFLVAGALFLIVKQRNGGKEDLKLVTVQKGSIAETALAVGTIEPENEIKVKSQISGIISEIYFKVGDQLGKGAPLFKISPNPTPLEYAEARRGMEMTESNWKYASDEMNRLKKLFDAQLISRSEKEYADMLYREASLKYKAAREKFQLLEKGRVKVSDKNIDSIIKSPIAGVVLSQDVHEGDPVVPLTNFQPGTELCAMADLKYMLFKGTVDEIDVGKLTPGMETDIQVGALPGTRVIGKLERISPKARKDGNSTLFDIEILILDSANQRLRAGYSANAEIKIRERKDVVVIPERLVIFEGGKRFVEIQDGEKISRLEVKTGLSDGLNIEITSHLEPGATLIERPPREIE